MYSLRSSNTDADAPPFTFSPDWCLAGSLPWIFMQLQGSYIDTITHFFNLNHATNARTSTLAFDSERRPLSLTHIASKSIRITQLVDNVFRSLQRQDGES